MYLCATAEHRINHIIHTYTIIRIMIISKQTAPSRTFPLVLIAITLKSKHRSCSVVNHFNPLVDYPNI